MQCCHVVWCVQAGAYFSEELQTQVWTTAHTHTHSTSTHTHRTHSARRTYVGAGRMADDVDLRLRLPGCGASLLMSTGWIYTGSAQLPKHTYVLTGCSSWMHCWSMAKSNWCVCTGAPTLQLGLLVAASVWAQCFSCETHTYTRTWGGCVSLRFMPKQLSAEVPPCGKYSCCMREGPVLCPAGTYKSPRLTCVLSHIGGGAAVLFCACVQGCRAISPIWMSYYIDVRLDCCRTR